MITKNSVNYTNLFAKATDLLKTYDGQNENFKIDNIDEYFQHIKTLAAIELHQNDELATPVPDDVYIDPIYTILPIDEALFEIDANTREIKVPKHFKDHGVGVKGDEIAEIIYFSIDRYFDAIDLANMDILIQWSHSGDDVSENLDFTYKRSLDYASGKIVFGWPISGAMTDKPGDINFSVRFYELDAANERLLYSFSTKTATIRVQKGLDFQLNSDALTRASNYADKIYRNIRNTTSPTPGYIIASPIFVQYAIRNANTDAFLDTNILESDIDSVSTKPCQFKVRANIAQEDLDNGEKMGIGGLKYEWYYKDSDGKSTLLPSLSVYDKVSKDDMISNDYYYYKDDGGDYHIYTSAIEADEIYQKSAVVTPTRAGIYYAKATNTYNFDEIATGASREWMVPYPAQPNIEMEYAKVYRIANDADGVIITIDIPEDQPQGSLTKQWYYGVTDNFTASEFILSNQNNITATQEGYYFLELANARNGSVATAVADAIHVLHDPGEISAVVCSELSVNIANSPELTVTVELNKNYTSTLKYQWSKESGDQWTDIVGAITNKYTPINPGRYRCEVTNIYEGKESTPVQSSVFEVYSLG